MIAALLLAAFGASHVDAQTSPGTAAFAYKGCSSVDLSCFGSPVAVPNGRLITQACKEACHGRQLAIVLPDACYCGDNEKGLEAVAERLCNTFCGGDLTWGPCGGEDQDGKVNIASVFKRASPGQDGAVGKASLSARAAESPCHTSGTEASATPPAAPLITPVGPAPEVPVFISSVLSDAFSEVPWVTPALPEAPRPSEASTTPCSQPNQPVTEMPSPPQPTVVTTGPNPPAYFPGGEASPTSQGPAAPSRVPSKTTLWPVAPYAPGSSEIPPQVPEGDATHHMATSLSLLGALIAVMIM